MSLRGRIHTIDECQVIIFRANSNSISYQIPFVPADREISPFVPNCFGKINIRHMFEAGKLEMIERAQQELPQRRVGHREVMSRLAGFGYPGAIVVT